MTKQRIASGTTTKWGLEENALTEIDECKSFAAPETETEYKEATHLKSPGNKKEWVPGLEDDGTLTLPCGYTSGVYEQALAYKRKLLWFETTLPVEDGQTSGDVFKFRGYVTPKVQTTPAGDIIGLNLVVRTSGDFSFTKGAAA